MIRLMKYIVIKHEDMIAALSPHQKDLFFSLLDTIKAYRVKQGKKTNNKYLVLNEDEPYTEICWKILALYKDQEQSFADWLQGQLV